MKSSSIEMSLGIEGRKGGQSVIGAGNVGREETEQQRPQTRRNKLQHQSLQTVGSVINQSQSVVSRQGLLQSVPGASFLGEKDKFAVAVRLIVVGSSRLFLLANLFWTYSDQLILLPTNLFHKYKTKSKSETFCSLVATVL